MTGVLLTCAAFSYIPADEWTNRITDALEKFYHDYPQEKVYLHFDKDYYAAGETIWFKSYVTLQELPAYGARNLYVELIDKDGIVIQKRIVELNEGGGAGEIELPETFKSGTYQARAYTSYMMNYDSSFFFHKNIRVYDPKKDAAAAARPTGGNTLGGDAAGAKSAYSVQFFPEGGDMIAGVASQVAFKAINQGGYPTKVSGTVSDSKGEKIAELSTFHDGMGLFEFTPKAGETYTAKTKDSAGTEKTFSLPAAKPSGVGMRVYNKGSRIFYLTALSNQEDTAYAQMLLVAQMQNQLIYKAVLNVAEGKISGLIPTKNLPNGIMQITLFKRDGTPLAERLAFVRNNLEEIPMIISANSVSKGPRTKTELVLDLPDANRGQLSVSVTDADQVEHDEYDNNIVSHSLLTSDLKGYVHRPGWYFRDTTENTLKALDMVMMTNGWRRFSWEKIIANQYPTFRYPYEQGLTVLGVAKKGNRPLVNGNVSFMVKTPVDSGQMIAMAPTNEKGEFALANIQFKDTGLVYYKANDPEKKGAWIDVSITRHFFELANPVKMPYPFMIPPPLSTNVLKSYLTTVNEGNVVNRRVNDKTIYLKEFNVTSRKPTQAETIDKRYASGMFSGDGQVFDFTTENPVAMNVFQYLQARVAGLQITGNMNEPQLSWRGDKPQLFLDQMPVDVQMIANLPITDIAMVKVFRPPFMGGFGGGAGGAIAIYTRRGGDTPRDNTVKGFELYKKWGYNVVRTFYSPDYAVKKPIHELPDKRLTLYWNPQLNIDTIQNVARFDFYSNDFSKRFRVVVEGMDVNGNVGRVEKIFE
ncbi:MG2 domain-containing protein [Chitinophaga horti]|uniref:MG2 domain-containing protein n=1 Tax=Chitinophaga horti TaxID=2920382 RepID=A0ABY6IYF4_9BACT|nr:MG2 domain-containing protein [Chitinophaga horti]UYQ91044.1 MG2 domain-containing protein [Chitinophaga horti]